LPEEFDQKTATWRQPTQTARTAGQRETPCLIVITGNELGKLFQIARDEMFIGRHRDCDVCVSDDAVSRRHARIVRMGDRVLVEDLDSTNGTFVNGVRIKKETLQDGDKILVGTTAILKFSYQDALEIQFQEHLFSSAVKDWLTQCYNKRYLEERLAAEYPYALRHNMSLALILFDLDYFKAVNDTHGHLVGDYVLRGVCDRVRGLLRREEFLARYGGEEFVILARETGADGARVLAERCREGIASGRFEHGGQVVPMTASFGVAEFADGKPPTPEGLIQAADEAMYLAKKHGRNRVEIAGAT
jgi:two-component system, cell cycle response regulator